MPDQQTLWTQYMATLAAKIQLQAGEALQAVYPFEPWDWGGRNPPADSYPYEQWELLNVVPSDPYQNTNAGAATSQKGFDTAYSNWFNVLAIGDLEHDQHYGALQDAYAQSLRKYTNDYSAAQNTWRNQTGGTSPDFTTWLGQPGQLAISGQLDEDNQDAAAKRKELDEYRARIQTPVDDIVSAYNDKDAQGYSTDPQTGKSVPLRLWETVPAVPFEYVMEITGNTFGSDATKGHADSFTMNYESSTYQYSKFFAEAGGGWWDDFIGAGAEGDYEKIDWSSFSDSYSISMDFQDLSTVVINPAGWYAGTNITSYGKGPYATGFAAFASGNNNYFFGPGGALSRIYTGIVVAYRPKVTISASEEFASYMLQKWQTEAGVEIGPFFFGSKATSEQTSATAEKQNASFVVSSTADWPMIIGMKSAWTLSPQA